MLIALSIVVLLLLLSVAALTLGGPNMPPPMPGIGERYRAIDFSALPQLRHFEADDGERLAYRAYVPASVPARGSVVLIHGSSGSSRGMHPLAAGLAAAGYAVYALDIRGHGASGSPGTITYVGQLEDDMAAFMRQIKPEAPTVLAGFSAGGGFALRLAGSERQEMFDGYLLLSPFLGEDAPTLRPGGGGWVKVGMPRMLALSALNALGIRRFNDLPVVRFALNKEAQAMLTPAYSFSLASNFRPLRDYQRNIRAVRRPCVVVAGIDDDVFYADRLEPVLRDLGQAWPVTLVPGISHADLPLDARGIAATVRALTLACAAAKRSARVPSPRAVTEM